MSNTSRIMIKDSYGKLLLYWPSFIHNSHTLEKLLPFYIWVYNLFGSVKSGKLRKQADLTNVYALIFVFSVLLLELPCENSWASY